MGQVVRFSVSMEEDLLQRFDQFCTDEKFATRSEAVRQLVRDRLTRQAWEAGDHEVAGTLTIVYDHHRQPLRDSLLEIQHDHTDLIVSALHAHLSHHLCLEVIILRGPAHRLQKLGATLGGLKGIFKAELVMAAGSDE